MQIKRTALGVCGEGEWGGGGKEVQTIMNVFLRIDSGPASVSTVI